MNITSLNLLALLSHCLDRIQPDHPDSPNQLYIEVAIIIEFKSWGRLLNTTTYKKLKNTIEIIGNSILNIEL
ncbi:MAG: hypothetical protein HRT47_01020 [Candidatus Caenarcaniphilales bacterium]|nr:hypothetical protein [Candidatus Caenarcaniphilales bacterium]